jgi:signal recognition particle subunit SRP54
LVADAMTGQEALSIAGEFHRRLRLTGIILTKMDGDARGGAALSMVEVTGVPIKFIGTGEGLEALEPFHPERLAGRILGMGDLLSLIEEAEERLDRKRAEELAERLVKEEFTLQDFLDQLRQVRRLGPLERIMEKLPGAGHIRVEEKELIKVEAIINSMTREERLNPQIIDGSRKRRIARGSGTQVSEVNRLLKRFNEARRMMKQLGKLGKRGKLPLEELPF